MGNSIKYSEGSESLALNKGNWWIGTGDTNKGPTAESGYWNAINPPSGGYTVYLNKESNGPSIHSISNNEQLISFTNKISGNNYVNVAECLVYYQTQDDKLCVNREYENIVTDGLVLNLDAGHASSYPTSGTTWYDLSGNGNDGTLINGPIYSGGSIVFDGADDNAFSTTSHSYLSSSATELFFLVNNFSNQNTTIIGGYDQGDGQNFSSAIIGMIFINNISKKVVSSVITTTQVYRTVTSITELNTNQYYHVLLNKDTISGNLQLFINGVLESNITFDVTTYAQWPTVGTFRGSNIIRLSNTLSSSSYFGNVGSKFLNGKIPLLRLYNRTLTPQEVLQNYNALKGRFGL